MTPADELYRRLKVGPAVLFIGQDYLRLETGVDPFLAEVVRKYAVGKRAGPAYHQILDSEAANFVESALAWMDERCKRFSVPEWLRLVANYPWSALYSSAIDSMLPGALRTLWREIQPLFEEKYRPSDPRNRLLLHCTLLFGCVNRTEQGERPPLSEFEFIRRRQIAVALARRLPETVTPLGTLVVEGYAGDSDWLTLHDFLPIIDSFNKGQVHLFSAQQSLEQDSYARALVAEGKLVLHNESLAAVLAKGVNRGLITLGQPAGDDEHGQHIQLEDRQLVVPRDIWNQVSRSAVVLDDRILVPPPSLSTDALYREFRSFLSRAGGRPQWAAYARQLAFRRHFERALQQEVERRLGAKQLRDEPIILHGQTGTGKTCGP